ncbi:type II secretion system F family protein [Bowmanella denitrificans]|uniref:Type II secretion system F family protein n=1 Tax=Bowmanella denitrificans TaxID=366582 RepID=A0ABP3GSX1_9ALTE
MSQFQYTAYDSMGAKVSGEITSDSEQTARTELQRKNLIVTELKLKAADRTWFSLSMGRNRVSLKQLEFITSELAILLRSGVRFDRGLTILLKGAKEPGLARLLTDIAKEIKSGKGIAETFSQFPNVFDPLYISMIKLGEASGELDEVFLRLAKDLKFRRSLQQKILQAVTYPTVILFVCIASILFVLNYIVPQMSSLFEGNDALPVYTEILLFTSQWFRDYQIYLGGGLLLLVMLFIKGRESPQVKSRMDDWLLGLPVLGKAVLLIERIRFNSSMAMMLSSGVSLIQALNLSAGTIKNKQIAKHAETSVNHVKQGGSLTNALGMTPLFSDFNLSLVEVGEESGELAPVFDEIAERSRSDFEGWVQTLTSMIEPMLILVMGAIVGSVVVVMLLSIVSANDVAF